MAEETGQDKTEEPSAKRLNDAREKGQVPRSKEFTTVLVLIASAAGMMFLGERMIRSVSEVMTKSFSFSRKEMFNPLEMAHHIIYALQTISLDLGAFLGITVLAAVIAPASTGGWNFSAQAMGVKLEKLDPIKGLKRIVGPQGLIELIKALAKFLLVGIISTLIIWSLRDQLLSLGQQEVNAAMADLGMLVLWFFMAISSSLILIALIDIPFQHWNHTRQLKMTKQDVPEADVIITNPTHYAVALRYDQTGNGAPTVVAKGVDLIAQQIRMVGEANEVPVLSAPPLTRAIYFGTEIGEEIPSGLYIALAQVLAFVFQLRRYNTRGGRKPHIKPEDLPIPDELKRD